MYLVKDKIIKQNDNIIEHYILKSKKIKKKERYSIFRKLVYIPFKELINNPSEIVMNITCNKGVYDFNYKNSYNLKNLTDEEEKRCFNIVSDLLEQFILYLESIHLDILSDYSLRNIVCKIQILRESDIHFIYNYEVIENGKF